MKPTRTMTALLMTLLVATLLALSGCIAQGDDLQSDEGETNADDGDTATTEEDEEAAGADGPEHERTPEPHYADGTMLSMSDRTFTWEVPEDAGEFWIQATWSLGSMTDVELEDPDGEIVTLADTMTGDAQAYSTIYETDDVAPGTWSIHVDTMTYAYVQFEVWY